MLQWASANRSISFYLHLITEKLHDNEETLYGTITLELYDWLQLDVL